MVQLLAAGDGTLKIYKKFQFHYGSIISGDCNHVRKGVVPFQFHYGSIIS